MNRCRHILALLALCLYSITGMQGCNEQLPTGAPNAGAYTIAYAAAPGVQEPSRIHLSDGAQSSVLDSSLSATSMAWSQDGTKLLYFSSAGLGIYAPATGQNVVVSAEPTSGTAWAPDGTRFAAIHNNKALTLYSAVETAILNVGGILNQYNHNFLYGQLTWSPDSKYMLANSAKLHGWVNEVNTLRYDATTGDTISLTASLDLPAEYAWNKTGALAITLPVGFIYPTDGIGYESADIFVMNADGSSKQNVTNDAMVYRYPAWSPDGTTIAATKRDDDANIAVPTNHGLVLITAATGTQRVIVPDATINYGFSPDGNYLLYAVGNQLYVQGVHGGGRSPIGSSYHSFGAYSAAWKP